MRVLKKYPNRRLYDTQTSSYITLADVQGMVMSAQDIVVRDAKTSEDLTRSILLQIILEEESGGVPMFSAQVLSQIIRFYGHAMQGMMGSYLEKNLQTFTDIQGRLAEQSKGLYDPAAMTPELWTQFLNGQAPVVQGLMGNYMEQSRKMFVQCRKWPSRPVRYSPDAGLHCRATAVRRALGPSGSRAGPALAVRQRECPPWASTIAHTAPAQTGTVALGR